MIDRRVIEISDVIEQIAKLPQNTMFLYSIIMNEGGHTIG